jgi:hypothetical protein
MAASHARPVSSRHPDERIVKETGNAVALPGVSGETGETGGYVGKAMSRLKQPRLCSRAQPDRQERLRRYHAQLPDDFGGSVDAFPQRRYMCGMNVERFHQSLTTTTATGGSSTGCMR